MVDRRTDRWAAHPVLAGLVRLAVVLVPLILSVLTAILAGRLLPAGDTRLARLGWWLAIFGLSSLVLYLSDRVARRVLPLAVLLELSLVFPDHAPSRLRTLRTASVRDLESRLARLRAHGATTPPLEAAETLVTMVGVLGLHDKRTRGHSERVRAYVDLLTDEMGLSDEERGRARWAALVHDLGKLSVPAAVLCKSDALDDDEWETVRRHPDEGVRLAAGLMPWLGDWGRAIGEHHERWDGLGYPNGFAGEEIALSARILSVADSYEVMTSARSYSRTRSASLARAELTACAGSQFDPHVVRVFLSISLGKLRWVLGPLTWFAEVPLLLGRGGEAARLAAAGLGVGGLAIVGTIAPPASAAPSTAAPSGVDAGASAPSVQATPAPGVSSASPTESAAPAASPTASALRTAAASTLAAPGPTAAAPRPSSSPTRVAARPASTYWFTAGPGNTLATTAPTQGGPPPDTDRDGRPGRSLVPTKSGLDATSARERLVLTRSLDAPLRLVGVPSVTLWSRLAAAKGNGRVQIRLEDCTSAGSCSALADGQLEAGSWSSGTTFVDHAIDLSAVDVTVPAGHRLRLTVVANANGTSGDLLVAIGSRTAPSRIELPVR
ncbi:MAG: HD domain-containing protein [Frankiaceae bacterium]|nr:HD domain-containing protein [Frankiaceae bacterium]